MDRVEQLYLRDYDAVMAWAVRVFHNCEDAEDAVAQAFLKIANHGVPEQVCRAWVFRIVKNVCFDMLRRREVETRCVGRRVRLALSRDGNGAVLEQPDMDVVMAHTAVTDDHLDSPETCLLANELIAQIKQVLTTLTRQQRLSLEMSLFDEYEPREIEECLNLNRSQLKSSLFRARTRMREEISRYQRRSR